MKLVDKIEQWYNQKLWSAEMVYKAVETGAITIDDAERILRVFEEDEE